MSVKVREKTKGSGEWWVFINHNGVRKSKKIGGKTAANKIKAEIERQIASRDFHLTKAQAPHFREYASKWVEEFIAPRRSALTYSRYSGLLRNKINGHIGAKRLDEITRGDVKRLLLAELKAGASTSAVDLMLCVCSGVFNAALDDEVINVNPCTNLSRSLDLNRTKGKSIHPLTRDESTRVMEKIPGEYYTFFLAAFKTAARLGELCALRWDDINWQRGIINVQRTAKDQTVKESTKTYTSRGIEMSGELVHELQRHKRKDAARCLKEGLEQRYIFHTGGHLYGQNTIRRVWHRALKQAGIDRRRFHEIRHTTASTLLARGVPLPAVSHMLGHSSPNITLQVYSHYMPSEHKGFTNLLDDRSGDVKEHVGGR